MIEEKRNTFADDEELASSRQRTDLQGRLIGNSLLMALPESEFVSLSQHLEFVSLQTQQVLHEPSREIEHVYFLNSGLVSLLVVTNDARSVEVGMVGRDGCVGGGVAAGMRRSSQRAQVQIPGDALRIKADDFNSLVDESPAMQALLNRYVLLQGLQVGQLAACNRLHEVDERLARWLLMSHDRANGNSFPITHDQLAQMLGSGRPSVTVAAGGLQRAGAIEYKRGQVRVVNRDGLENAACECYKAMHRIRASTEGRGVGRSDSQALNTAEML
jgi:CRP-like cAMP-binding protein